MSPDEVPTARTPEEYLRLALEAPTPERRARFAAEGLEAEEVEPDTELLLCRQVYLAHVAAHRFQAALAVAERMCGLGRMPDVAHHDASRAFAALGDVRGAIEQQRLAARSAPPERRSFHHWALATLLHFSGDPDGAVGALDRGLRWAREDRPLLRGHRAWVLLEVGRPVEDLEEILEVLERAPRGYGELVAGMLRYHLGDARRAAVHLRAFLRRNAAADVAKALTLREELRRARLALASIESD